MRKLLSVVLLTVFILYYSVPGIGQIDPLKTAKDLGKRLPEKKDPTPPPSSTRTPTTTRPESPAPKTTSSPSAAPASPTPDPAVENSPAKSFIGSFWKAIEKLKILRSEQKYNGYYSQISSAEMNLNNIKTRDPQYNTKPLEAALNEFKAEHQGQRDQQVVSRNKMASTIDFMDNLFSQKPLAYESSGVDSVSASLAKHKTKLQAFNSSIAQFLAESPDPKIVTEWEAKISDKAGAVKADLALYEKSIMSNTHESALTTYMEVLSMETFWGALLKIYPQNSIANDAHQQVKASLGRLGSEEQMRNRFKQNLQEKIKNTKMPVAVTTNAAIEADFKRIFNENGWGETVLKISLLNREWTTLYHQVTGNVMGRMHRAAIAAKRKNGNCSLYEFTIVQEYTGAGGYGPSRQYQNHSVLADVFLCEYAK